MKIKTHFWIAIIGVILPACSDDALAFYNSQSGRWLNRAPIGETVQRNLYAFVDGDTISYIDADGRRPAQPAPPAQQLQLSLRPGKPDPQYCGQFLWISQWLVSPSNLNKKGGWIVQKITITWNITGRNRKPAVSKTTGLSSPLTYYEAWPVSATESTPVPTDDTFSWGYEPCTSGTVTFTATASFHHDIPLEPPPGDMVNGNPATLAGKYIPSSLSAPRLTGGTTSFAAELAAA